MEIVKKNILSVICGVVALISLLALVWPVSGMYDDTRDALEKRKKTDTEINNLIKAPRSWPVIPAGQSADKPALKRFPNDDVIKRGVELKSQVLAQANDMRDAIDRDNRHEPVIPGVLPNPGDNRFKFHEAYLAMVQDAPGRPARLKTDVEAIVPPTEADIRAEADRIWTATYEPKILKVAGQEVNREQVDAEWLKECDGLTDKMYAATAGSGKVYVEPTWLSIQKDMLQNTEAPKDQEIWYAQNMLWVQMDLIDGIKRLNAPAKDVRSATVKHIFQIDVAGDSTMYVNNLDLPANAPPPGPNEIPAKVYSRSFTGRVSNPLYDVIEFHMMINVDAAKIPLILTELQRNKLITILQADHVAVNGIKAAEDGYIYGDVGVARLTIKGEELFLRSWTVPLMPSQIAPPAPK